MPYQPVNFGNAMIQGENILNARHSRDPNSLQNQFLAEKINALRNPSAGSGLRVAPLSPKDLTVKSIAEAMRTGNLDQLERYERPDSAYKVDTEDATEFWGINRYTEEPVLIKRIPKNLGSSAYADETQKQRAQAGLPPSAAPVTAGELNPGVQQPSPAAPTPTAASLAGAKTAATAEATAKVKEKVEKKRLSKAYNTYKVGVGKLRDALDKTMGGAFIGRMPAVTAEAQIAEQAKAMMLPILKGIVRGAGEGVFTDQDAMAVLALIPDRIADEDARDKIFENIDAFIASKLMQDEPAGDSGNTVNWSDL